MEEHFDINEQGLSIRCKLICSASDKTARSFDHIAIVTHGFGSNKETAGTSNFGEHLTSKFKGWGVIAFDWPCHGMEHALSAYYDITHGEGLAIITPRWMKHILSEKTVDRFVKYGVNVFGIDLNLDRFDIANRAIEETYKFFASIGIPMHLKEVGIDESRIDEMAHHVAENEGLENAWAPLQEKDIADIFRASL